MGSTGTRRALITLVVMAIVSAIGAVFYVPAFIDGSQEGPERVQVERLLEGYRPKTSYVVLTARPLPGPEGITRSYYVPLVPVDGGTTVPAVLHDLAEPDLEGLAHQTEFEGILQGAALYDGLTDEIRERLAQSAQRPLAAEILVLDTEWTPPMRMDMAWGILSGSITAGLILGLAVAFIMVGKRPRRES